MVRPAPKPRKYEMMIVVAPTVTEDGLPAVVERVSGVVEAEGGSIESLSHDSPWGHRRLAYPIQNFRDAFYVLFYFHCAPRGISEIERELRLDAAIIRHLVVKFDPLTVRDGEGAGTDGEDVSVDGEDVAPAPAEAEAPPQVENVEDAAPAVDDDASESTEEPAESTATVEDAAPDADNGETDSEDDAVEGAETVEDVADSNGEDEPDDGEDNET